MTHRLFAVKRCLEEASFYEFESKIVPAHFLCVLTSIFLHQISSVCWRETKKLKNFYLVPGRKCAKLPLKVIKSFLLLEDKNWKTVSLKKNLRVWFLSFIPSRILTINEPWNPQKIQRKFLSAAFSLILYWEKKVFNEA